MNIPNLYLEVKYLIIALKLVEREEMFKLYSKKREEGVMKKRFSYMA